MPEERVPPVDLEPITALARQFADLELNTEAAAIFELALRLDPANRGVQLSLAKLRNHLKQGHEDQERERVRKVRETFRRNAIDSCHFFGLAALYEERGKPELAAECLAIALGKEPVNPYVYKLQGRLLLEDGDPQGAKETLRAAQRYNPFDRQIAELLGRAETALGNRRRALEAAIDAFLLLRENDAESAAPLKVEIRDLKRALQLDAEGIAEIFRERRIKLQTAFDRLELQRERFLQEGEARDDGAPDPESGRIMLAARLRQVDLWSRLNDDHIFQLTRAAHHETHSKGTKIFAYGDKGADLYVVEQGEIVVQRPTHYGDFELARLPPGTLFGEVNFISRIERSGDIVAGTDVHLVRLDADQLEALIAERPDLGVELFFCFWQGLAQKLRGANEQLRTFFEEEGNPGDLMGGREEGSSVEIGSAEKMELLREQGLSGSELQTLADFSDVKRFPSGTFLFREGDPGHEMYVVLEGRVMISKYIPGGGEEALAILGRGDFFGEMALIDGEPRSADAKAFGGPATVVAFDQLTLKEVQSVDPRASIDFIRLLCHLMSQRLREIDEKVTTWRIMAGHRPGLDDTVGFEMPPILAS
ncbi:MAG: cyclic nucleotide-binding domain-containing protein [Acidobacteriota bacterium]